MSSNLKALADKGQARPALVPKLRFPDFQDAREWEVSTIGELKPFVTSGSRGWAPFYSDNGDLFVRITNLLRDSINLDLTDSKYVQLPPGANEGVRTQLKEHDVLISITADIGIIGYVDECIPSPAYINQHIALVRFDEEQVCGKYVAYFLAAEKSQKLFRASTDTGTKAGMSLTGIQKIMIMFPGLPEQQKIAECLSSVDDLIAAQARKVAALKTHKKGLMHQLFPREGETQPRLRFPEFQNAGEWETKELGKVAENLDNKRRPITSSDRESGDVPYYGASGIVDYVEGYIFDEDLLCVSEDGANLVARTYPIAFPISGKTWVNNHAHVLRFEATCTQKFVEMYLHSIKLDDFITGMAQPKLNKAMLDRIPIPHTTVGEQKRIVTCLSSLDSLITAETQKHEALKTHKKGLMQQLFPSMDEDKS
jgi:type I restriction enzyme S subunit